MRGVVRQKQVASQASFLRQFEANGEIGPAARAAGISRDTHYHWLKTDAAYAKAFAEAGVMRIEVLETELRRRALVGWDEPVYYQGQRVGAVRRFDGEALRFALKAEKPEKYRERYGMEHSGPNGGPIRTQIVPLDGLSDEELALARKLAEKVLTHVIE